MKIGALVPARISSRRLPRKNIAPLGGKPLICWTLDPLLEAGVFQDVTVSTDSEEVADLVRSLYPASAVSILMRPERLCEYGASLDEVIAHCFMQRPDVDILGVFMPTFPFRETPRLREIDRALRSRYPWRVSSLTDDRFCTADFFMPKDDLGVKKIFDSRPLYCRASQAAYAYWHRCCVGGLWQRYFHTMNERVLYVTISDREAVDIDTAEDFEVARNHAEGRRMQCLPVQEHVHGDWTIITPRGLDIQAFIDWIGPERFEDMDHPLLVLEECRHIFARFLMLSEIVGRSHFRNIEAYTHIVAPPGIVSHQSQTFPREYMASPFYRLLRLRPGEADFVTSKDYHDHHGLDFGTNYGEFDSTEYKIHETGAMFAPDILPWRRIIRMEELKQQPFYVDPVSFA